MKEEEREDVVVVGGCRRTGRLELGGKGGKSQGRWMERQRGREWREGRRGCRLERQRLRCRAEMSDESEAFWEGASIGLLRLPPVCHRGWKIYDDTVGAVTSTCGDGVKEPSALSPPVTLIDPDWP